MENKVDFGRIKELTHGYLEVDNYQLMYKYALNAPSGCIVDIGPAQGGSTICFAHAKMKNKNLGMIYSIDKYRGSSALYDYEDINKNVRKLKQNLALYGLEDLSVPLVYGRDDIHSILEGKKISVLFIDADGAIDRDMESYINNVVEGGIIIIDDYELKINVQAATRYLKWRTKNQINSFLVENEVKDLLMFTPLGKHYTTYMLTDYFIKNNFIEVIECNHNTLFARKNKNSQKFSLKTKQDLVKIRKTILNEFQHRRTIIEDCYNRIEYEVRTLMITHNCSAALLFENYFYPAKFRYQTVNVLNIDLYGNCEKQYKKMQDINLSDIKKINDELRKGNCIDLGEKEIIDLDENTIFTEFFKDHYNESAHLIPIIIEHEFWGFLLLCNSLTNWQGLKKEEKNNLIKIIQSVQDVIQHESTICIDKQ